MSGSIGNGVNGLQQYSRGRNFVDQLGVADTQQLCGVLV
jgi:hypothetical protein